jgi:hypothetical protein
LPFGGVAPAGGGAPPGAVLGGVAVGALDELAFGPVFSGVLAGGPLSDGAAGPVDCCFAQPAAIISAAIDIKTRLRFMEHLSDGRERKSHFVGRQQASFPRHARVNFPDALHQQSPPRHPRTGHA